VSDTEEFVYAFDATPAIEEEPEDITLLRRHVEAKIRNGDAGENLSGIYRAGYHLNNDDSVYYVGKANDAIDRLERHLQGATHSGSNFPHLFRPTEGVIEITGVGPNEDADKAEEERAAAFTETGYSWAYFN